MTSSRSVAVIASRSSPRRRTEGVRRVIATTLSPCWRLIRLYDETKRQALAYCAPMLTTSSTHALRRRSARRGRWTGSQTSRSRLSRGRVGGRVAKAPVLRDYDRTQVGKAAHRSGVYLADEENLVVIGSNAATAARRRGSPEGES